MGRGERASTSLLGFRLKPRDQRRLTEAEFLAQKKPANEVYKKLDSLSGLDLLQAEPVRHMMDYARNWDPFIANKDPQVTMNTPGIHVSRETGSIALPYPFITPSTRESTNKPQWPDKQFDWDIYFINKGLLATGNPQYVDIAKGHIENFQYLFDRLGFIPNASDISLTNRSQIPFLTGMILDIYKVTGDKEWFAQKITFAKKEYEEWMASQDELRARGSARVSHRIASDSLLVRALSRDIEKEHYTAAAETGEDDSAEWARRAHEYVPVTLNCAMYKYESDFARAADILGDPVDKAFWEQRAQQRKEEINNVLWDEKSGRYANAALDRKSGEWVRDTQYQGLSSFMPLWIGLATGQQADRMMQYLPKFESPNGLTIATKESAPSAKWVRRRVRLALIGKEWHRYQPAVLDVFAPQQWDYPNVWAPMEYFAVDGMIRYGKFAEAQRVLEKSLKGLTAFFAEHGTLPEKFDGATGQNGADYNYPNQEGFGWTNAWAQIAYDRLTHLYARDNVYDKIAS